MITIWRYVSTRYSIAIGQPQLNDPSALEFRQVWTHLLWCVFLHAGDWVSESGGGDEPRGWVAPSFTLQLSTVPTCYPIAQATGPPFLVIGVLLCPLTCFITIPVYNPQNLGFDVIQAQGPRSGSFVHSPNCCYSVGLLTN